jgi:hypothetical protein
MTELAMTTALTTDPKVWNSELGQFINDNHRRFAEILVDFKPTYSLVYIPEADRTQPEDHAKPFAILDSPDNAPAYIVRYLTPKEMDEPEKVLAWLFMGDTVRHGAENVFNRIQAEEDAKQLMQMKNREDELEDMAEFAEFLLQGGRDKLHTFKHNGKVYER